jgi:hypothetical protein
VVVDTLLMSLRLGGEDNFSAAPHLRDNAIVTIAAIFSTTSSKSSA